MRHSVKSPQGRRFLGIDVGAETIKLAELIQQNGSLTWTRRLVADHHKDPAPLLLDLLKDWDWNGVSGAAASGRLSSNLGLGRIPAKQAQAAAFRHLVKAPQGTIVSIGSNGFSVLEVHSNGLDTFRQNGRCSQGTGNFLRQLVERFQMSVQEADDCCVGVKNPAPLSGRCPVILKTDMTHLANQGESRPNILAGLFDAVCDNIQMLIKPRACPPNVILIGGVAQSRRVQANFKHYLASRKMELVELSGDEGLFFEALGSALLALEEAGDGVPPLEQVLVSPKLAHLDTVPALGNSLKQVRRLPRPPVPNGQNLTSGVVLGFDIGSTGSKLAVVNTSTGEMIWDAYVCTNGNPVRAAQQLMELFAQCPYGQAPVRCIGVTGSGREIVGSLMSICYGPRSIHIMNEIVAHAEGALYCDRRVDTIFEIGGQDAKYIRLVDSRVVDAAMNEACSAGTGSFIEEQGKKFGDSMDVVQLAEKAVAAPSGVSLGQHCSVFMAGVIDEAVAAGVDQNSIIAGIYDSVILNYLNRVKGGREVGKVVFCQGKPFTSDALAAAVARQTGSEVIIPPNPGAVGAHGIALLARNDSELLPSENSLQPHRFLEARVQQKNTFVCRSTVGCGGAGNRCRIDRLATLLGDQRSVFRWGGGCSLFDNGIRKQKLPERAPDPFRQRRELLDELVQRLSKRRGRRRVALTDEFQLKETFPFFATFLEALGFDLVVSTGAGTAELHRGIEQANVRFCAPMQQYHGLVGCLAEQQTDFLFLPMVRSLPRAKSEPDSVVCPTVQASADVIRLDLPESIRPRVLSPVIDVGIDGLRSQKFKQCCQNLAQQLGVRGRGWERSFAAALAEQERFTGKCLDLGRQAVEFCGQHSVIPIVVLGRPYTIYNNTLNSNVPALLREQGTLAIPVDCYPVGPDVPAFEKIFWAHGQLNLRAAHQIRRTRGVYGIYCSNYSCGPDSFVLHFFSYIMQGKPFAVVETDGHSGDAGTKTRVEAFLHCVRQDLERKTAAPKPLDFRKMQGEKLNMATARRGQGTVLIPPMGPAAAALAACLRGTGIAAELLDGADRETVPTGRRHTSGKECFPMAVTAGLWLQRLQRECDPHRSFVLFMPTAHGPCRFGVYHMLHRIIQQRQGLEERIRIWSPADSGYFEGVPAGFTALTFSGVMAADLLLDCLHHVRPLERCIGDAESIYDSYWAELLTLLEREAARPLSFSRALSEVGSRRLFGCRDLLRRAARDFAPVARDESIPTVLLVGEIYVRSHPFTNDFIVDRLEKRGLRVRLAPTNEFLEFAEWVNFNEGRPRGIGARISNKLQSRIQTLSYDTVASILKWPPRTTVDEMMSAATPYLSDAFIAESVITLGGPIHDWRKRIIDGVVNVGPLECMPSKVAEAQFFHVAEREELLSVTIPFHGDPIDTSLLDSFAFEVHSRFRHRSARAER